MTTAMNQIWDEINKIPPTTRFIILSTLSITLISLPFPSLVGMHTALVLPQIWRAFTCFFILSKSLNGLFDLVILFRTSTDLEGSGGGRAGAAFAWGRIVDAMLILVLNYPINAYSLFRPFFLSLVYTQSLSSPHSHVNLFGLASIPNNIYPYVILAIDMLLGGPVMVIVGLTGIIAAHFRHLMSISPSPVPAPLRSIISTPPSWFERWWIATDAKERRTGYGTAYNPTQQRTQAQAHSWGTGRRLAD
ncbi:hypothetical protein E3P99_01240 [Wallemia hederae]|uniref:Derlin n=1 Tax=Wallemia hederae TaxID=1540922 RepID=A0A4T0FR46_9BASI|nr:hypothetical protein E3P99_01240 [Wallemia hederae]